MHFECIYKKINLVLEVLNKSQVRFMVTDSPRSCFVFQQFFNILVFIIDVSMTILFFSEILQKYLSCYYRNFIFHDSSSEYFDSDSIGGYILFVISSWGLLYIKILCKYIFTMSNWPKIFCLFIQMFSGITELCGHYQVLSCS